MGLKCKVLKTQMCAQMQPYGHQVGQVITTNLLSSSEVHMLLTPLWLVVVLQYLTNPSFIVLSILVRRHYKSFVILTGASYKPMSVWSFMQF